MKKGFVVAAVCLVVALACNNLCNGHGICGSKDRCDCYPGWGGSDCSLRSCPYGEAFVDTILGDIDHNGKIEQQYVKTEWNPVVGKEENLQNTISTTGRIHRYAECSNAGLCNRETGDCECFEGYEGSACQRRFCPSTGGEVCAGHGQCISIRQYVSQRESVDYVSWETDKFYKCVCDPNWDGIDCSERVCPKGLDPVTQYEKPVTYKFFIESRDIKLNTSDIIQQYNVSTKSYHNITINDNITSIPYYVDDFVIKYTSNGVTYTSPVINGRVESCPASIQSEVLDKDELVLESTDASQFQEEIKRAIRRIPPLSQVNVTVACATEKDEPMLKEITTTCPDTDKLLDIDRSSDFDDKDNGKVYCEEKPTRVKINANNDKIYYFGYIVTIQMEYADRKAAENAVMTIEKNIRTFKLQYDSAKISYPPASISVITSNLYNDRPRLIADTCSGRGICDRTTGFCTCFPGYYGYACDNQRTLPIPQ